MKGISKGAVEYWAFVAQIVSSAAVVVSVLYLSIQITGSVTELKAQTHYNALTLSQRPLELAIANQELAEIVATGMDAPDKLSPEQWLRFSYFQLTSWNAWEYMYLLKETNSIPDSLWGGADAYYRELIKTKPGLRKFWREYRFNWVDPFLSYTDELVAEAEPPAPKE